MKAQLRTYHAIPSLQAHTDSNAYKQLQDAPRLKSILKGACENQSDPQTLDQVMALKPPRTNPINLVFILSTYAPKVSECHFPENMDFYDLVMRTTLSSKSRARAFLWLMWLYLESEFTEQECLENPFGRGKYGRDKSMPWCVPEFEYLNEEQALRENVDTEEELAYGEAKREERKRTHPHTRSRQSRKHAFANHSPQVCLERSTTPRPAKDEAAVERVVSCITMLSSTQWYLTRSTVATAASPDVQSPTASPPAGMKPPLPSTDDP